MSDRWRARAVTADPGVRLTRVLTHEHPADLPPRPRRRGEQIIEVAWALFPDLRIERGTQTYARAGEDVLGYRSGSFVADLTVDADGLVVRYGDDLWQRAQV